jgi:hypothetical protein
LPTKAHFSSHCPSRAGGEKRYHLCLHAMGMLTG